MEIAAHSSVLGMHPMPTARVNNTISEIITAVKEGEIDPLKIWMVLSDLENIAKGVKDAIRKDAVAEAEKYEKGASRYGKSFRVQETGTKYDFGYCEEWLSVKNSEIEVAEKRKEIEAQLKTGNCYSTETGEVYPKPMKKSTTTIIIEK